MTSSFARIVLVAFSSVVLSGCNREAAQVEATPAASRIASNSSVAVGPARTEYEGLKGKWQRGDGDYIIDVRGADAEGKLDAAYFNPSPIKVSQARAYREGGALKMFVELRDVNYPGCTYKLTYDANSDQLSGQYFQAAIQETYEVAFARVK